MVFPMNGVVEAPAIVPSAFGLLAVVKPENSADEDRWIRGFSQEWETTVDTLTNWDDTDSSSYVLVNNATVNYYDEIKPFFIELEEVRSGLGFLGIDRIARIKRQLEGKPPWGEEGFPSEYASKSPGENFAEMIAAYCLGRLSPALQELLKTIV